MAISGTTILSGILFFTFSFLLCIYHWKRRHLYKSASQLKNLLKCWPIVGSLPELSGGDIKAFEAINKASKQCEDIGIFWLGNQLNYLVANPEYVEKILNNHKFLNKPSIYNFLQPLFGNGLITGPVHIWKKNRKLIAPTLHPRIIDTFMDTFNERIEEFTKKLNSRIGETFDIFEPLAVCSSIISIETSMGVKIQENDMAVVNNLDKALSLGIKKPFSLIYTFDFIYKLFETGKEFFKACKFCSDFTKKVIAERRKEFEKEKVNDDVCKIDREKNIFIDQLLQLSLNGSKITDQQLEDETKTIILAATDTSAAATAFFLMFMGMNPEIQELVYEEIMEVVGADRYVTSTDLLNLKYLDRAIKESLRICPPIPIVLRSNEEDLILDKATIVKGTDSTINILGIHRNPKIWPDPFKFDPDRFLPEECAKRHPCSFIPFSSGPRNCIGRQYGLMVTKTLLVHLIRKYKFSTPITSVENMKCRYNITMKPVDGILVSFVERQ